MKRKQSNKSTVRKIELDAEVVADLEATDTETEAIQGGRSSSGGSVVGSVAGSNVT